MQLILLALFLFGIAQGQLWETTRYTITLPRIPIPARTTPVPSAEDGSDASSGTVPLSTIPFLNRPWRLGNPNTPNYTLPSLIRPLAPNLGRWNLTLPDRPRPSFRPELRRWNLTLPDRPRPSFRPDQGRWNLTLPDRTRPSFRPDLGRWNLSSSGPRWNLTLPRPQLPLSIIRSNGSESTPTRPWRWEYNGGRLNVSGGRPQIQWPSSGSRQPQKSHTIYYTNGGRDENTSKQADQSSPPSSNSGQASAESGEGSVSHGSTSGSSGGSVSSGGSGSLEGSDSGQASASDEASAATD